MPSATPKVRSRSDQRSPPSSASEPMTAPATTRASPSASRRTWSRARSRSAMLNMSGLLRLRIRLQLLERAQDSRAHDVADAAQVRDVVGGVGSDDQEVG